MTVRVSSIGLMWDFLRIAALPHCRATSRNKSARFVLRTERSLEDEKMLALAYACNSCIIAGSLHSCYSNEIGYSVWWGVKSGLPTTGSVSFSVPNG